MPADLEQQGLGRRSDLIVKNRERDTPLPQPFHSLYGTASSGDYYNYSRNNNKNERKRNKDKSLNKFRQKQMKKKSGPSIKLRLGICGYNSSSSSGSDSETDSDKTLYFPDQNKDKRGNGNRQQEIDSTSNGVVVGGVIEQQELQKKQVSEEGGSGFTWSQLQQFSLQLFICNCFVLGLPLPLHILLSFWNSVALTFATLPSTPVVSHPVAAAPWTLSSSSARQMETVQMDPEPGRCRRTDGKKWRCSKDVVPNQKYCERHMHRGAGRSRKLVEAATSKPSTTKHLINLNSPHHHGHMDSGSTNITLASPHSAKSTRPLGGCDTSMHKRFKEDNNNNNNVNINETVKTKVYVDVVDVAAAPSTQQMDQGYRSHPPSMTSQMKRSSGTKIVFKSSLLARNNKNNGGGGGGDVGQGSTSGLDFSPNSVLQTHGTSLKDH